MSALTAAVVGLGAIGLEYDYDDRTQEKILTHARAYARHPGFRLVAGVDPDPVQRRRFETRYRVPAYASLAEMNGVTPEVVSIAVPAPALTQAFGEALGCAPRAILCEKPFAQSAAEGAACLARAREAGCLVAVNYVRRFDPGVHALKADLDAGRFGAIARGHAWYAKGLFNNASHAIDLLRLLLGEAQAVEVLRPGRELGGDCEPDFVVRFGEADVWFLAHRHEHFAFGQIDLLAAAGRILLGRGGHAIETYATQASPDFPGYRVLSAPQSVPGDMGRYQLHVLDGLWDALSGRRPMSSDGESALRTLSVLDEIRRQRDHHVT